MLLAQRRSIIRYARTNRIFQLFLLSAVLGTFLLWLRFIYYEDPISTFPEVYRPYYQLQRSMPQHNSSLPYPEGSDGRYLYFDQIHGLGWNNVFQELYMLAHLAYVTNRALVYRPYTWSQGYSNFAYKSSRYSPSRIPETVILSGPIIGGDFPHSAHLDPKHPPPRAVSEEYFNSVCPRTRRWRLNLNELHKGLAFAEGSKIFEHYFKIIENVKEGCLELSGKKEYPFDWRVFGDKQAHSLWPIIRSSPILTHFSWSDTVLAALARNAHLLSPSFRSHMYSHPGSIPPPHISPPPLPTAPSLLAIHLRRGDYIHHCDHLAKYTSSFVAWAQFPGLPEQDKFAPPKQLPGKIGTENVKQIYADRCWPSIERIVEKVNQVRREWEESIPNSAKDENRVPLTRLYIMTNGDKEWVSDLKHQLSKLGNWESVTTSQDLKPTEAQKWIAQAVDMAIAERAGVFIGNGFSSLSANVALLRMVKQLTLDSIRFW